MYQIRAYHAGHWHYVCLTSKCEPYMCAFHDLAYTWDDKGTVDFVIKFIANLPGIIGYTLELHSLEAQKVS